MRVEVAVFRVKFAENTSDCKAAERILLKLRGCTRIEQKLHV